MESYSQLNRAQLSFDYLHTNSTTHEFLFGAIAELIDNSRDAGATELDIYTIKDSSVRGNFLLCFADNGCGMSPGNINSGGKIFSDDVKNVIIFGKSLKRSEESSSIGMYGNGLKSGSMRIGNDMMLFTKKDGIMTCLFLSRSFHEEEKLDEVVVPLPSFKGSEKAPLVETPEDKKKHDIEMHLILKYSPFRCQKDFFAQFDKLKEASGTLVIIYNMKLLNHGGPELDIVTNPRDILLASGSENEETVEPDAEMLLPPERRSLRAYVSILYSDPRMKVYLQGRKVQTKRLLSTLHSTRRYNFASKTFRTRAEADLAKAKNDVKIGKFAWSHFSFILRQVRRLRNTAAELRSMVSVRQNIVARKQKSIRDPKTLTFYFGVNVMNRACDGMFVYNCSRLIKMYQRIGPQQDSSMMCRGVVGIVDVPYMVLEPTHNKQDFADAKEYRMLMRAMADHLMQYWDDLGIDKEADSLVRFWKSFGYLSARWRDPPSNEEKYARRRCCSVSVCVQCDKCLKWRILPFSQSLVGRDVPDTWQCRDNPDHKHKRCDDPEEDMSPPMGVLKRKIKTKEQRQAELEKLIRKKQEELELIQDPDDETENSSSTGSRSGRLSAPVTGKTAVAHTPPSASPRKRAPPTPTPGPPTKKPTAVVPPRAVTVADKKKQAAVAANGPTTTPIQKRTGLPLPTSNQRQPRSGGLVPKIQRQTPSGPKSRRTVVEDDESSEDEEEEEEQERVASEEEKLDERHAAKEALQTKANDKSKPVKPSSVPSAQNGRAPVSERVDSSKSTNAPSKGPTVTEDSSDKNANTSTPRDSLSTEARTEKSKDKIQDSLPDQLPPTKNLDQTVSVPSLSVESIALNKRIQDKFKVCLRYFLPPEWPMQKDQIHTLTDLELANFPLEDFFDRYEQGLRSLLATFQQETKVYVDRLTDVRCNVVKLLNQVDPASKDVPMDADEIDNYLSSYLSKSN
ncbi:hypothetical protein P879_04884 [Paragonimus westermani]|uniref:CW-type domain-containing protein n=1 Tax=Paragonimus westermani TaxID=34504 RepID=A0A8T0DFK3_9TREM|nr:hypothetical protein P879_04884 [Paragonimus westermani]